MKKSIFLSLIFLLSFSTITSLYSGQSVQVKPSVSKPGSKDLEKNDNKIEQIKNVVDLYLEYGAVSLTADQKKQVVENLLKEPELISLMQEQEVIESLIKRIGYSNMNDANKLLLARNQIPGVVYSNVAGFLSSFVFSAAVTAINSLLIKNRWYFGYADKAMKIATVLYALKAAVACKTSHEALDQIELIKPFVNRYNETVQKIIQLVRVEILKKQSFLEGNNTVKK